MLTDSYGLWLYSRKGMQPFMRKYSGCHAGVKEFVICRHYPYGGRRNYPRYWGGR
jgi:hypothetical protein